MDIKIGDIVFWYENGHTARKEGQVISISIEFADVYCSKDMKVYTVEISSLTKV